ncbi:MAG TPA: aminotransferase class I/II-fold pyridoxal phosphate-dependent enzyme [Gemmatimonadaceae bacterium]|jgi:histidinol-phosphate aminotransferase|nr:aminotransferase class I/II-fold pyridoxal phosphate-dependent enzyme [Gemmatimonadaceae bacterium]
MTPMTGRAVYRDIALYGTERERCAIDLSDNTNLWGMPPAARAAAQAAATGATKYPNVYARGLKGVLADYLGVEPEMIVTGCGSDDVIDSAIRAFADPGERFAYLDPTFPMASTFARMNGLVAVPVPLTADYDADADGLLATGARIMYLCSPNNPTGTLVSRATIERVVADAPGVVMIDEAYAEFAGVSSVDLLARSDRLLITRTMSKAFGLAGLRIGYGAAAPALIAEVEKSRGPYKVNVVAEQAAYAALTEDREWVAEHVAEAVANRRRFEQALAAIPGVRVVPSFGNFVFAHTSQPSAGIVTALCARGIGVRGYPDGIRITIGPWPLMAQCLEALAARAGS